MCDVRNAAALARAIAAASPELIIHAQAMADVDACERDPAAAETLNIQATAEVARLARDCGAALVFMSTGYVFDGHQPRPYAESDAPNPVSVYGRTKRRAEELALAHPRALVVRTSTVFGPGRATFCDEIVERLRQGQQIRAFADQRVSPTYSEDLAEALAELLPRLASEDGLPSRIMHLVNDGHCTRLEFARHIASWLGLPSAGIEAVLLATHAGAARPPQAALVSEYVKDLRGATLRPWVHALDAYLHARHSIG